jgi:hypothetical protein
MERLIHIIAVLCLVSCDNGPQPAVGINAESVQQVSGAIPPDTIYLGSFVNGPAGICGLILIEAGDSFGQIKIQFDAESSPPHFLVENMLQADCKPGEITVSDLVTGQTHLASAPHTMNTIDRFTREYIEILTL